MRKGLRTWGVGWEDVGRGPARVSVAAQCAYLMGVQKVVEAPGEGALREAKCVEHRADEVACAHGQRQVQGCGIEGVVPARVEVEVEHWEEAGERQHDVQHRAERAVPSDSAGDGRQGQTVGGRVGRGWERLNEGWEGRGRRVGGR